MADILEDHKEILKRIKAGEFKNGFSDDIPEMEKDFVVYVMCCAGMCPGYRPTDHIYDRKEFYAKLKAN